MEDKTKSKNLPLYKKVIFLLIVMILVVVVAEGGLRIAKSVLRPNASAKGPVRDCNAIVIICAGDSMTFGLGARQTQSYPMQLPPIWKWRYPGIPLKVYNLAVSGSNSTEVLIDILKFLRLHPKSAPDFAFILCGANNKWNLHNASFWKWDKKAKKDNYSEYLASKLQINKFFKVATQNSKELTKKVRKTHSNEYRKLLDEHGWDMFFKGFDDELLAQWVEHDYLEMVRVLKKHHIEPVFLTYHYDRFEHLNDLIRNFGKKHNVKIVDIEKPFLFYQKGSMFHPDLFHLNSKGYQTMSRLVLQAFAPNYDTPAIQSILKQKKNRKQCRNRTSK